jgi:fatty-acyl-CoA synthase
MAKILNDWPSRWAAVAPDRVAASEPLRGTSVTWSALDAQAGSIARFLAREAHVGPGDRVAVLAENRLETIAAFFAVARLRATLVPLNTKLTTFELGRVFQDASPKALLVSGSMANVASELLAATTHPGTRAPVVIALDGSRKGSIELEHVLAGPRDESEALVDEEDPWLVLYTSGSTGAPKGALVTHRQIVWNALQTLVACDLTRNDTTLTYTPLFYTGGWNVLSTPLWYTGGKVHILPSFEANTIADLVVKEKVSVLFGVPTTLSALRETPVFSSSNGNASVSSLRVVLVGGASCPPALVRAYGERGIALRQGYGLTEVGPNCFGLSPEDALRKVGSIGRPNMHLEWRVTDEQGKDVPEGAEGELRLRGPIVFGGYLNNEAATRAALDTSGFFRTGDVVRVDAEGHFWVVGRKGDMFKSGGEKVYAGEVEAAIAAHEGVAEVVVLGVPDEKWGEVGRAIVVKRAAATLDDASLRTWLTTRLAKFKVPKTVVFVDALPRTETGKIARAKVKERWGQIASLAASPAPAGVS